MQKQILKFFLILTTFLMLPNFVLAAPSVSTVSGTVSHDSTVTISGSGFGVKSPVAPLKWDPVDGMYLGLVNGQQIPMGGSNPWPGPGVANQEPYYKTSNPRGKWTAKYSNQWSTINHGAATVGETNFSSVGSGVLYISWWMYPDNDPSNAPASSNKFFRLTDNGGWSGSGHPTIIWEPIDILFANDQLNGNYKVDRYYTWAGHGGNVGAWNRNEITVDNGASPKPSIAIYINNGLWGNVSSNSTWCVDGGCTTGSLGLNITGIYTLGADWSNMQHSPTPRVDFGEIYVDNTRARVEICNASSKATSDHCEIQIPQKTWNDGQLQIKVNQGSFPDNSTAYLFVVDANGDASAGKQITFGSSQTSTCIDLIQNGNETGIDCGGSCPVCIQTYSISNFLTLVSNWLKVGTASDVNSDNIVNTKDLGIMMSKWH